MRPTMKKDQPCSVPSTFPSSIMESASSSTRFVIKIT